MLLKNKKVWITGASSGIGRALTLELATLGANIIISSRRREDLQEVKNACPEPDRIRVTPMDLSDHAAIAGIVDQVLEDGPVDILINNGGISQRSKAMDTQFEVDKKIMSVNYFGTVALTKALLPSMISRKEGHVVVISSVTGKVGTPHRSGYAASKHALHGYFDALRAEHHDDNIAVTLICPGFIQTNISMNALTGDGSPQNTMDTKTSQGLTPEALAKKVVKAIKKRRREVYIGGSEILAIYVKRFFPGLMARIIRKIKVK